jgi:hypothetical protein
MLIIIIGYTGDFRIHLRVNKNTVFSLQYRLGTLFEFTFFVLQMQVDDAPISVMQKIILSAFTSVIIIIIIIIMSIFSITIFHYPHAH